MLNEYGEETTRIAGDQEIGALPMTRIDGEDAPTSHGTFAAKAQGEAFDRAASLAAMQRADEENEEAFSGMPTDEIRKRLEYSRLEARARLMVASQDRFQDEEFGAIFRELNKRRFIADDRTLAAFDVIDGDGKPTNLSRLRDFLAFSDRLSAAKDTDEAQGLLEEKFISPELKAWREATALDAPNGIANDGKFGTTMWMDPNGNPVGTDNRARIAREYFARNGRSWGDKIAGLREAVGNPNDWIEGTTGEYFSDRRAIKEYEKVIAADILRVEAAKVMPFLTDAQRNLVNLAAADADMEQFRGIFKAMNKEDRELMYSMCQAVRPSWDGNWFSEMVVRGATGVRSAFRSGSRAVRSLTSAVFDDEKERKALADGMIDDIHWAESVADLKLKDPESFVRKALEGYADSASLQYSMLGGALLKRAGASLPGWQGKALAGAGYLGEGYAALSMIGEQFDNMLLHGIDLNRAAPLAVCGGLVDTWIERWNIETWMGAGLKPAEMKRVGIRAAFRAALKMDGAEFARVLRTNAKQAITIAATETAEEMVQGWNQEGWLGLAEGRNAMDAFVSSEAVTGGMDALWEALPSCTAFGVFGAANPTGSVAGSANDAYREHLLTVSSAVAKRKGIDNLAKAGEEIAIRLAENEAVRIVRATSGMTAKERNAWINAQDDLSLAEKQFYVEHCEMYAASVAQDGKEWADAHLSGSIDEAMFAKAGWKFGHDKDGNITSIVSKDGREWKVRAENRTATIDDLTDKQVRNLVDEFNALVDDKELEGEEKFKQVNGKSDLEKWSEDEVKRLNSVVGRVEGWYNDDGITLFLGIADEGTLSHELTHSFIEKLENANGRTSRRHLRGLAELLGSNFNERTAVEVGGAVRAEATRQKEATSPERVSIAGFSKNAVEVLKRVITLGMKRGDWSKMFKDGTGGKGIDPNSHFAVVLGRAAEALETRRRMEEKQAKERKAISDRFKAEREAKRQAKIAARKGEADAANAELSAEESAAIDEQEEAALAEMEARHEQERRDMETLERVISPDESGATRERNGTVRKFIESQGGDAGKFPLLSLWSERGAIFNKPFDKTDPLWDDYRHMEMSKSIQRLVFGWGAKAERGKGNDGVAAEIAATHPQFAGMSEHELLEAFLAEYGKYKEWKRNGAKSEDEIASEEEFNKLLSEVSPDEARQLLEAQSRMADVDTMLDNGMISGRDADEMKIDILSDESLADVFRRAGFGSVADEFHTDFAIARKYGIGSSAVNGDGFVDLAPGDTFGGVEQYVQSLVDAKVSNDALGIKATIGSKRNAEHLAQKMSQFGDEVEEAHKYAVKNILPLFAKSNLGIVQHDKKGGPNDYIRAFTPFSFGGAQYAATITLRRENGGDKIYTVEAVEIENTESSPRSSRRTAQGAQPSVSLRDRIAYYVGDVNATNPSFIGKDADTPFSVDALESRVREELEYFNDGTRTHFSLKSPVERTKDLVALHNMSEDAVKSTADLGGFAIPSIAIFKNTYGHNEFGEVSVLFGKETIDPRKNRLNRVYSHDAWTATFPAISNKIDQQAIERKNEELIATLDERLTQPLYNAIYYLRNDDGVRDSWDRATDAGDAYGRNDALKAAYLVSRGEKVEPVYKDKTYIRGGHQRVYMLHEDGLRSLYESPVGRKLIDIYLGPGAESVEQYEAIAPQVAQIFRDIIWKREYEGKPDVEGYTQDQVIGHYFTGDNQLNYGELYAIAEALTRLDEDVKGGKVGMQEIDEYKTRDAISGRVADNDPGFVAWLNEQYGNPILGKGVYNGAARFTRMGNRRSWDALHDPATLENIVRAMKKTQKENGNGIFGSNPFGVAARTLRSMQDIFATENILKELTPEEEKAIKAELSNRLSDIVGRYGKTQKSPDENPFIAADRAADMMFDAYQKYGQSIAGLKRELNGWGYSADDQLVQDFADLMAAIEMMPTNYFEAKPQRPVRFDEPKAWIVPHDAKPETLKTLRGNGQRIYTYRRGDNADRLRVVNEAANDTDALFSVRNPGGAQKRSDLAYPDATPEISNIPDGLFSIGNRKREEFKNLIVRKRPDFKDPDRAVEEIGKFATPKEQKAALKWIIGGRLILPEDAPKVTEAIRYAEKAKKDPLQYDGPVELMNALAEFKPKDKPIDPDTVPELYNRTEMGDGVVVYNVDEDAGQVPMRKIINTHWGEDANPWCLLQGDGHGNLSDGSDGGYNAREYWDHYNALPKKVAFRNGKLLAFMATDEIEREQYGSPDNRLVTAYPEEYKAYNAWMETDEGQEESPSFYEYLEHEGIDIVPPEQWWDRNDEDHPGIPLGNQAVPNDPLGRFADFIIDKDGRKITEGAFHKVNDQVDIWWNNDGSITQYRDKISGFSANYDSSGFVATVRFRTGDKLGEYAAQFDHGRLMTLNIGGRVEYNDDGSFAYRFDGWGNEYTFLEFTKDRELEPSANNTFTEAMGTDGKMVTMEVAAKRIASRIAAIEDAARAALDEAETIRDIYTVPVLASPTAVTPSEGQADAFSVRFDRKDPTDIIAGIVAMKTRKGEKMTINAVQKLLASVGADPSVGADLILRGQKSANRIENIVKGKALDDDTFLELATDESKKSRLLSFGEKMGMEGYKLGAADEQNLAALNEAKAAAVTAAMESAAGFSANAMELKYGFNLVDSVKNAHHAQVIKARKPQGKQDQPGEVNGEGITLTEMVAQEEENAAKPEQVAAPESAAMKELKAKAAKRADKIDAKFGLTGLNGMSPAQVADAKYQEQLDEYRRQHPEEDAGGGAGEEVPVKKSQVKREQLDFNRASDFIAFVEEVVARESGKDGLFVKKNGAYQCSPLDVRNLANTAKFFLKKVASRLLYSKDRELIMRDLDELHKATTLRGVESAVMNLYTRIQDRLIPESQEQLIHKLEWAGKQLAEQGPVLSRGGDERDRKVRAKVEEWWRMVKAYLRFKPEEVEEEKNRLLGIIRKREEIQEKEGGASPSFIEQDLKYRQAVDLLNALTQYGGLINRTPGEIADKSEEILGQLRGSRLELENAREDEYIRTRTISSHLQQAVINPKALKDNKKPNPNWFVRMMDSMMGVLEVRLRDLIRYSHGEVRRRAEADLQDIEDAIALGSQTYNVYKVDQQRAFDEMMKRVYGDSEKGVIRLTEPLDDADRKVLTKQGIEQMTRSWLLQRFVELQQTDDYAQNIAVNKRDGKWREDFDRIFKKYISEQDMTFLMWVRNWYRSNLVELNDKVLVPVSGIKQYSPGENYFPVKMKLPTRHGVDAQAKAWSPLPSWLTPRVYNNYDFDERTDLLTMWYQRMRESGASIAYARLGLNLSDILLNPAMKDAVSRNHGDVALRRLQEHITDIINGGAQPIEESDDSIAFADRLRAWQTNLTLSCNYISSLKQMTSCPVYALRYDIDFGMVMKFMTDVDIGSVKELMASDGWKSRYGNGLSEAMQNAMRVNSVTATGKMAKATNFLHHLYNSGFAVMEFGDSVPCVWCGQGLYRYFLAKIRDQEGGSAAMSEEEMKRKAMTRTWAVIEMTQQSKRTENLTAAQRGGPLGRFLYQFVSSPVQQLAYEVQAVREALAARGTEHAAEANKHLGRVLVVNHILMPNFLRLAAIVGGLPLGQIPNKDDLFWDFLMQTLIGQYGCIFLAGAVGEGTLNALRTGKFDYKSQGLPVTGILDLFQKLGIFAHDILLWNNEEFLDDVLKLMKSTGAPTRHISNAIDNWGRGKIERNLRTWR